MAAYTPLSEGSCKLNQQELSLIPQSHSPCISEFIVNYVGLWFVFLKSI